MDDLIAAGIEDANVERAYLELVETVQGLSELAEHQAKAKPALDARAFFGTEEESLRRCLATPSSSSS